MTAITGLGVAVYKFRDSTFTLAGSTYELRDAWKATGTELGDVAKAFWDADKSVGELQLKLTGKIIPDGLADEVKKVADAFWIGVRASANCS